MAISTLVDRVKIVALSSGVGPFQLGAAVPGFRGTEALLDGATYSYATESGARFEVGTGVYVSSTGLLVRSPVSSSNGGASVPFPANVEIAFTVLAQDIVATGATFPIVDALGENPAVAVSQKATTDGLALKLNISDLPLAVQLLNALSVQATATIAAGAFVNLYNASGNLRVRPARANDPATFASGFVLASIASGASGLVFPEGWNDVAAGTPGPEVWLSDTIAGAVTTAPPTASGSIIQPLGVITPTRGIYFTPRERVLL